MLACPCGEHMVTAPGPVQAYEGAQYGPGFMSHLLVARTLDTTTFGCMERQFARLDIPIAKATMVGLFHRSAQCLSPLADRILELVRQHTVVLADETRMKMQLKFETGKDGTGYVWAFLADKLVAYRVSPSRSGETPRQVLEGTPGTLVVDAYSGYNQVTGPDSRKRAGCWAHVRRKFFDALSTAPEAQVAMDLILDLYQVEHDAQEEGVVRKPEHLQLRRERSKPVVKKLKLWLEEQKGLHLPKGAMGKAISYALNYWTALTHFLKSEQTPIDNNASYVARGISLVMPRPRLCRVAGLVRGWDSLRLPLTRHNHRDSRKASRLSDGLKVEGASPDAVEWASARCLSSRSACR